jgi:hypothetical protein
MKAATKVTAVLVAVLALVLAADSGCNPATIKTIARSAIDVTLAACIAEHADIEDEPALKEICKWTDDLAPLVQELIASRKKGMAKASAKMGACGGSVAPKADGGK